MRRTNDPVDDAFEASLRRALDEGTARLDAGTRTALATARRRALARAERRRRPRWWPAPGGPRPWPLAGAAASLAAAVLAVAIWQDGTPYDSALPAVEDLELLTAAPDPEFFEELEFFLWLEGEPDAG